MLHTTIVKVANKTGRGEIVTYSHADVVAKGLTLNSGMLTEKPIGSLWVCEIDIPNTGSRKIRSIQPYVESTPIHSISNQGMNNDVSVEDVGLPSQSTVIDVIPTDIVVSDNVTTVDIIESPVNVTDAPTIDNTAIVPVNMPVVAKTLTELDFSKWGDDKFYVGKETQEIFKTAYNLIRLDNSRAVKLMLSGASGDGKSTLAQQAAKFMGLEFLFVNCATMKDVTDWFGTIWVDERNGASTMRYEPSEFAEAMVRGNCVICLDEFNRVESTLHNALFPILDDRGETTVYKMNFKVGPNVIFVGTVNLGYQYDGTSQIDTAMFNRFDMIYEVESLPFYVETNLLQKITGILPDQADTIVKIATAIRDNAVTSCSTRSTLSIARMVYAGLDIVSAFDTNIVRRIPNDDAGNNVRKNVKDLVRTLSTLESDTI